MKNYHIRAYRYQIESWDMCAKIIDIPVSVWVRENLNRVATKVISPNFHETEMKRGRKQSDEEISESFQFRITPWERSEWTQCADSEGLTTGEWCRQSLDHVAGYISRFKKVS